MEVFERRSLFKPDDASGVDGSRYSPCELDLDLWAVCQELGNGRFLENAA
jgi:hypothetical protein